MKETGFQTVKYFKDPACLGLPQVLSPLKNSDTGLGLRRGGASLPWHLVSTKVCPENLLGVQQCIGCWKYDSEDMP